MMEAVAVVSTSLRSGSYSRILARNAYRDLVEMGVPGEWLDLGDQALPFCDGESCYQDPQVEAVQSKLSRSAAVILATPVYNYDSSAAAKNLIELAGRAFEEKVVAFLCSAGGRTSYMAVMSLANSLMLDFRCLIVPRFVYATRSDFEGEEIASEEVRTRVRGLVERTVELARCLEKSCSTTS